ncbi:unnamed protein product, partial [Rotaria sp. Silwood2]
IIVFLFIGVAAVTAGSTNDDHMSKALMIGASLLFFIVAVVVIVAFILTIVIVKFAFKLARLIDAKQTIAIQRS